MSHSILTVIEAQDSIKADSVRRRRCNNSKLDSDISSLISTSRDAGAPIIFPGQTDYGRREDMSAPINLAAPAEPLYQPAFEKNNVSVSHDAKFRRPGPNCGSELHWWKPPTRVATQKFAMIEMFVFVVFLVLAVIATSNCFIELFHLLDGGILGHLAANALRGGA